MALRTRSLPGTATRWRTAPSATDRLTRLRWLTTIAPAIAVFGYESVRHAVLDHVLAIPEAYGNFLTGMLALLVCFWFSRAIFNWVQQIQQDAVEETRKAAAFASMVEERERLSRELHDGLAQVASYVLVRLDTVRNLVESGRDTEATAELETLRDAVAEVNADVRESIAGLRSRVVERGLVPALEDYLEAFEERHGISADMHVQPGLPPVPPQVALQLFRVAQEGLTNVRKHAMAEHVHLEISSPDSRQLIIALTDDGCGFDVDAPAKRGRSYGLASMSERIGSLGGSLKIDSAPGRGTTVSMVVTPEATS